jgi:hypothetical protein
MELIFLIQDILRFLIFLFDFKSKTLLHLADLLLLEIKAKQIQFKGGNIVGDTQQKINALSGNIKDVQKNMLEQTIIINNLKQKRGKTEEQKLELIRAKDKQQKLVIKEKEMERDLDAFDRRGITKLKKNNWGPFKSFKALDEGLALTDTNTGDTFIEQIIKAINKGSGYIIAFFKYLINSLFEMSMKFFLPFFLVMSMGFSFVRFMVEPLIKT